MAAASHLRVLLDVRFHVFLPVGILLRERLVGFSSQRRTASLIPDSLRCTHKPVCASCPGALLLCPYRYLFGAPSTGAPLLNHSLDLLLRVWIPGDHLRLHATPICCQDRHGNELCRTRCDEMRCDAMVCFELESTKKSSWSGRLAGYTDPRSSHRLYTP